jgi:opacity protein-like surface antigen
VQLGGTVYVHFTKVFGASLELLYSQKGSRGESVKESPAIGTYVSKYFMNVNYAEVPLTVHAIIHTIDVEAGISYALLVRSNEWVQTDQPVVIDPDKNRFNSSDIDYVAGIGRRVYKNLFANVRYQYSAVSIRPPERIPSGFGYNNNGQFNNLFNFRLMYYF